MTLAALRYSRHESGYETGANPPGLARRSVRREEHAHGILVAALGVLAWHLGYRDAV